MKQNGTEANNSRNKGEDVSKTALTETDKKRMEEEKYRTEVRKDLSETPKQKLRVGRICCFVLIIVFVVWRLVVTSINSSSTHQELVGTVKIDTFQLVVDVEGNEDWKECKFILNSKYQYPEKGKVIITVNNNETYTIGLGEFILEDGTRFNPFTIKPLDISIKCSNGSKFLEW
jgi:hypothetical protein